MKVIILKEGLNNGLNIVERVTGKNLTLPVLNNVLISTEKNFLNLSTTDLELAINYWVLVKTEKEGKITIPARPLSGFVNSLPEKQLTLEVKDQVLYINCENLKAQIKGLSAEEFPIIPKIENNDFIKLDNILFCSGLSQVVDFTAPSQIRPELSGVYIGFRKNNLQLAATDSFRLAEKTIFLGENINQECSLILPQKTAREIINILSEKQGELRVYLSPNQALFEYLMTETSHPQIQIISRLIEGEYPEYQEIIPKKYETEVVLTRNDFLNQLKTASIFSGKNNEVKIRVNPQNPGIEIFSQNPEVGENRSFLSGKLLISPASEVEISFNYRFLVEGLNNIKTQRIVFGLNGGEGPASLRPDGEISYTYVVMPIKAT